MAKVDHPNLAKYVDSCFEEGNTFIVTEYIDGVSLHQKLKASQPSIATKVDWLIDICQGVAALHEHLVLHRDLKPSNIIIADSGLAVVADFGLAKQLGDEERLTITGEFAGTPRYMAPEQLDRSNDLVLATDVYALGGVMYFLLTGQPPFEGASFIELADAIRKRQPKDPSVANPNVGKNLSTICLKCLSKSPHARYPSAIELANDFNRWRKGLPIEARPLNKISQAKYWIRSNPVSAFLAGACCVAVLAGLIASTVLWRRSVSNYVLAENNAKVATKKNKELLSLVQRIVDVEREATQNRRDTVVRRDMLIAIAESYDKIEKEKPFDKELLKSSGNAWLRLGRIENSLGNHEDGSRYIESAKAKFQRLAENFPEKLEYKFDVFHCLNSQRRFEEAFECIAWIVKKAPRNSDYQDAISHAYLMLADSQIKKGEYQQAINNCNKGEAISRSIADHPDRKKADFFRKKIALHLLFRFRARLLNGDTQQAKQDLDSSLASFKTIEESFKGDPEFFRRVITVLLSQSSWYMIDNEFADAAQHLAAADKASTEFLVTHPTLPTAISMRCNVLYQKALLAYLQEDINQLNDARDQLDSHFNKWKLFTEDHVNYRIYFATYLMECGLNKENNLKRAKELLNTIGEEQAVTARAKIALRSMKFTEAEMILQRRNSPFFLRYYHFYLQTTEQLRHGKRVDLDLLQIPDREYQRKSLAFSVGSFVHAFHARNFENELALIIEEH